MPPEHGHREEGRRIRRRLAHLAPMLIAVLIGFVAGGVSARIFINATHRDSNWGARLGTLEAEVERLKGDTVTVGRRVDEVAHVVTEARRATSSASAERARREPAGNTTRLTDLRLSGVIHSEGTRTALIEDARDQPYVARVGDMLPGGRVVAITDDTMTVEKSSGTRVEFRMTR